MKALPVLLLVTSLPAVSGIAASTATPPRKTHTLFMGADISVQRNDRFYRVEGVAGSAFRIRIGERDEFVATRQAANQLRIEHALKLGGTGAKLDKLVAQRVYTSARDPRRQFEAEAGAAAGAAAVADLAAMEVQKAEGAFVAPGARSSFAPREYVEQLERAAEEARRDHDDALAQQRSDFNNPAASEDRMRGKLAEELFDAIEVAFEVSSSVPLDDPHLLVIARIREPGARPGVFRNWIYADALDPIGPKPRFVRVREGGFPPGFFLEDCQVRIFNRGREVPTNIAPRRVELTRDDARKYVLVEHLAANKAATVAAAAVHGEPPAGLRGRIAAGEHARAYFVRVDAEGSPRGAFLDRACSQPVTDPEVGAFLDEVIYTPALVEGRPVEGIARVQLAELCR